MAFGSETFPTRFRPFFLAGESGAAVSEIDTQYDGDGNAIFVTNTVSQPSGGNRVTYTGNWYNGLDQPVTSVNYGTNGGTSMSARPDDAPSRSNTPGAPEVTSYTYTPEGYVDETTDPRGLVTKNCYDEEGNVTKTIDNYQGDGTPSADEPDVNQTTEFTFNDENQVVDQTAVDPGGVNQTTENEYGPSGADNDKGPLLAVEYPDPNTGDPSSSNEVKYTYNGDGTVATMTDRDGTTHTYEYDDDRNHDSAAEKGYFDIGRTENGGPDFAGSDYLYPAADGQTSVVRIRLTGSYTGDSNAANDEGGFQNGKPAGYSWHHVDDYDPVTGCATLQLVETSAHEATYSHAGGVAQWEAYNGKDYKR